MRSELLGEAIDPQPVDSTQDALAFVCKTISEAETVREVSQHGSRAEALASKAHEMHSRCLEALDGEPKPVTKKLSEILAGDPNLRVWGVTRKNGDCVLMLSWHWREWSNLDMAWCDGAWSCRPASGVYQQIMVFVPESDCE
jgi:hypothetical protein